jgi:pimeloyl-ACP methyl ester carboxylesterase
VLLHKNFSGLVFATIAALSFSAPAERAAAQPSQTCFPVALAGDSTEVCADVYQNSAAPFGATILAIHGFTETARVFEPLAEALFADNVLKFAVKRVIALDLPGHGDSEAPIGLPNALFGNLTLHDNVSVIIQAIDALRAQGIGPRVIMGHSMGGHAVAGVQEALLAQGSSLAAHGVYRAILLAPVPVLDVMWTQPPPSDLSAFVIADPALGAYLDLPPAIARIGGGFTTTAGALVSNTPTEAEMASLVGWEPLLTTLQLVGQAQGLPRLSCREGAFAPIRGTLLSVVALSEDILTPAIDLDDLYVHLIGRRGLLFRSVQGPEAVHNMFITDPEGLLEALKTMPLTW